jgi:hypothetical protein
MEYPATPTLSLAVQPRPTVVEETAVTVSDPGALGRKIAQDPEAAATVRTAGALLVDP